MEFIILLIKILAVVVVLFIAIEILGAAVVFFGNFMDVLNHVGRRLSKIVIRKFDDHFKE